MLWRPWDHKQEIWVAFLEMLGVSSQEPVSKAVSMKQSFPITMNLGRSVMCFICVSSCIILCSWITVLLNLYRGLCSLCPVNKLELMSTAPLAAVTDVRGSRCWARVRLALRFSRVAKRETLVLSLFYNVCIRKVIYVNCENGEVPRSRRKRMNIADDPATKN